MPERTPSAKRSVLIRAGVAALLVLVFIVVPGYLAMRPSFFGRFPAVAEKHGPWAKSTHASAGCQSCHVSPGVIAQGSYRVGMVGRFYVSLVSRSISPKAFAKPTNEACLSCHYDLRSVSPKGDLRIPHKAHVNILKMDCVTCHNYLVHEKSPEGKQAPTMAGCLKCHDGDTAKNTCTACHTDKAAPATHRAGDWQIVHGTKANTECATCHKWTDRWCADCHAKRPKSHTVQWRKQHGTIVEKHRSCEACHAGSFCIRCHGEVPQLNYDPLLKTVR